MSVLIPTRGRPDKLGRCLERLARQTLETERFEVLVGVDGRVGGEVGADAAEAMAARTAGSMRAVIHEFEHAGPGATRNRLVKHARGRLVLMLNDDVLPEPDLLEAHIRAHASIQQPRAGAVMVLGAAPWVPPAAGEDTLFDRMIRETSMVFFYDRMLEQLASGQVDSEHDWGFRHAWTLNLSTSRDVFEAVGGFDERLKYACYEDLEFAYRVQQSTGAPVRFAPEAVVHHDHRMAPEDYLRREEMLGRAAWSFAGASPQCAMSVFGRDLRTREELEYSQQFVQRESSIAERLRASMKTWARTPAEALGGAHGQAILRGLYEHHLLLKRWTWRRGLLAEASQASA